MRCLSKVRSFNLQEKKLDPRTISGYFIGHVKKSKGYRYYRPFHTTRIVESRNTKFHDTLSEEDHHHSQASGISHRLVVTHTHEVEKGIRQPGRSTHL